jgi:hypothetical protein
MNSNTCQNCKGKFEIPDIQQDILKRLDVPMPTWCPHCRLVRRMSYRNERTLYKRKCNAPGHEEEVISIFSPENNQNVYCQKSWWGDSWDGTTYAKDYDFGKPFFPQMHELWKSVPDLALANINGVGSEYCSITEGNKNCYLVIGGDFNENSLYSAFIFNSKDLVDCYWTKKSELCYEISECISCTNLLYSRFCEGCFDSAFLFNCKNCHHCFGCANLKNASYQIWNVQYTKEEYEKKMKELELAHFDNREKYKKEFEVFAKKFPRKYARILSSVNSTGDNIEHGKSVVNSFDVFGGAEDSYNLWLTYSQIKNSSDCDHSGKSSELSYECSTLYPASKVLFSRFILEGHDISYSYNCHNCSYLFGCVGLRNKQYCILNKQYTKEEYGELVSKIIHHMSALPYTNKAGIVYTYGEFFPMELSPFAYNETVAGEIAPLTKEEIALKGYTYQSPSTKSYTPTLGTEDIPKTISDITDDITKEVIACAHSAPPSAGSGGGMCRHNCATAFRITKEELEFYKRMNIPLPHLCSNCRHYERTSYRNPFILREGACHCAGLQSKDNGYKNTAAHSHGDQPCSIEFETNFPTDSDAIIYCEGCYQQEVA